MQFWSFFIAANLLKAFTGEDFLESKKLTGDILNCSICLMPVFGLEMSVDFGLPKVLPIIQACPKVFCFNFHWSAVLFSNFVSSYQLFVLRPPACLKAVSLR